MKKYRFVTGDRVIIGSALAVGILLFPKPSSAKPVGPLPSPKQPPNIVPLTPVEQLGKDIVFDKRNIAADANGNEVAFDLRNAPPAGTTPLFPPPEVLDNVQNVIGYTPAQATANGTTGVTAGNGQVGNLQLTASQEADLVNFLKILTDGYTKPNPVNSP